MLPVVPASPVTPLGLAAEDLRGKVLKTAAHLLEEASGRADCGIPGRGFVAAKVPSALEEIAHYAESGTGCGQLMGQGSFITSEFAFPYGANFAEVAVDTRTGKVSLRKFHALLDLRHTHQPGTGSWSDLRCQHESDWSYAAGSHSV